MSEAEESQSLFDKVDNVIKIATDTIPHAKKSKERDLLKAALEKLKEARKDAEATVVPGLNELKRIVEVQQAKAESMMKSIDEGLANLEKRKAQGMKDLNETAPVDNMSKTQLPKLKPIDPNLGKLLQEELLAHFGIQETGQSKPPRLGKDLWEEWK